MSLLAFLAAAHAAGIPFPTEAADWTALPCFESPADLSFDPWDDEADAPDGQDIVGDDAGPGGFTAQDDTYQYLRMRLDEDPFPNGEPTAHGWAFELDLDDDVTDYEVMVLVNGVSGQVELYRNTATTLPSDPADPPDAPPVATAYLNHVQTSVAGDSTWGATDDWFLDVAVERSVLADNGWDGQTLPPIRLATTGQTEGVDGDVACGAPADGGTILEGGGGFECATGAPGLASLGGIALLLGISRRRSPSSLFSRARAS